MMKFGLLTAILDGWTYEEAVDIAAQMGPASAILTVPVCWMMMHMPAMWWTMRQGRD